MSAGKDLTLILGPAVNTILEMSFETALDIEEEPDLWDLVKTVYPNYTPGAPMSIGTDIYIVKCIGRDGTDRIYYKISEDRAMAAVKLELADEDISYVQVNKMVDY